MATSLHLNIVRITDYPGVFIYVILKFKFKIKMYVTLVTENVLRENAKVLQGNTMFLRGTQTSFISTLSQKPHYSMCIRAWTKLVFKLTES